tara:strand:+ start:236 stop:823 length:588 start_codon:yes stop_codon:yes gene_type:complete
MDEYRENWPKQGMQIYGLSFPLPTWAHRIFASDGSVSAGGGMFRTPSAQEPGWKHIEVVDKDGNPPTHSNQRLYHKQTGRLVQQGLTQQVRMWATPRATMPDNLKSNPKINNKGRLVRRTGEDFSMNLVDQVQMWPTPTSKQNQHCPSMQSRGIACRNQRAAIQAEGGGQLNPTWVEWLMGFPLGWTDLDPSETP